MRILLLHDEVAPGARPDETDTLVQAEHLRADLESLGHAVRQTAVSLALEHVARGLMDDRPDAVVNLVESLAGRGALIHLVPALVESLGIPMTGCPAAAIHLTSNKLLGKRLLERAGVPTPAWRTIDQLRRAEPLFRKCEPGSGQLAGNEDRRWIIKSVWEHASIGLDEGSIIETDDPRALAEAIDRRLDRLGGEAFAERFLEGREFNVALLETESGVTVLPIAEIEFVGFEPSAPRIVGYRAKWDAGSHEYHHTPRRFEFPPSDQPLLTALESHARACWDAFGLRGYARVDFRVSPSGAPFALEVNTNPCLAPDAGFFAAFTRAGLTSRGVAEQLLAGALRGAHRSSKA